VKFSPQMLANEQVFLPRSNKPSDRTILVVAASSSHPAVSTVGRLGGRAPVVLVGAGALEEISPRPKDVSMDFTIRAQPATFDDRNGNFRKDDDETARAWSIAAAITRHESGAKAEQDGRAVVVGDSDCLGDPVIENAGNAYFAVDGARWLMGEESIAGETNTEEDKPVVHTRRENVAWFYSTVFAGPALVLAAGFVVTRRRGRKARGESAAPAKQEESR